MVREAAGCRRAHPSPAGMLHGESAARRCQFSSERLKSTQKSPHSCGARPASSPPIVIGGLLRPSHQGRSLSYPYWKKTRFGLKSDRDEDLDPVTVSTGSTSIWLRKEIHGDSGR